LISQILGAFGKEHSIYVPTIASGKGDELGQLVTLRDTIPPGANVAFDFSLCGRLPLNAVVFLGGLATLIRNQGGTVKARPQTMKRKLREELEENGFLAHLGIGNGVFATGALPFEHHAKLDKSRVMHYLEHKWLGGGIIKLSEELRTAIMGNTWEVYQNAFDHSDTPIGIVNCGAFDKKHRRLQLSVMDFGVGIPENIRRHRPPQPIDPRGAMRWAFANGTSTKAETVGYSRGLGLHLLKEFVKVNSGFMEVFSNEGYARISKGGESYRRRSFNFKGTLVHISLSADEAFYCFDHEAPKYLANLGQ
jgi:hypothetical protein